ncbi:MAG: radical SAM protein [Desulfocapsaceae bacterium]|nr:radical SAM protein [Desulfocapsaceae bacterium]
MRTGAPMGSGAEVFALPVRQAFLVCNPVAGVSALINGAALKSLRQQLSGVALPESVSASVAELAALLNQAAPCSQRQDQAPLHPQFLGILPTRACNIACRYCDFGAGAASHRTMDLRMARAAADWYAGFLQRSGQDLMEIHFFGGEPFIARDVVETVVHRGRVLAARNNLTPHFEVSTNGVFEADYARFVGDYFDAVILSFDGFREVHDLHRPMDSRRGSFEEVRQSAMLLAGSPAELCLRCCVTTANVDALEEIADWFCREFRPAAVNFETLSMNAKSQAAGLSPPDPYVFARSYYQARKVMQRHGIRSVYAAAQSMDGNCAGFCPVGRDTLIVSPDGRISSCYLPQAAWRQAGLALDVGRISADGSVTVDADAILRLRRLAEDKPRCINCFCRWSCGGGCHVSHTPPGSSLQYQDYCIQTRLISASMLLDAMGEEQAARVLLADRQAMEALALQRSDRIGVSR